MKKILSKHSCYFVRYGKGDHEIWYTPVHNKTFSIDGKIKKRTSANEFLKDAGIKLKV